MPCVIWNDLHSVNTRGRLQMTFPVLLFHQKTKYAAYIFCPPSQLFLSLTVICGAHELIRPSSLPVLAPSITPFLPWPVQWAVKRCTAYQHKHGLCPPPSLPACSAFRVSYMKKWRAQLYNVIFKSIQLCVFSIAPNHKLQMYLCTHTTSLSQNLTRASPAALNRVLIDCCHIWTVILIDIPSRFGDIFNAILFRKMMTMTILNLMWFSRTKLGKCWGYIYWYWTSLLWDLLFIYIYYFVFFTYSTRLVWYMMCNVLTGNRNSSKRRTFKSSEMPSGRSTTTTTLQHVGTLVK